MAREVIGFISAAIQNQIDAVEAEQKKAPERIVEFHLANGMINAQLAVAHGLVAIKEELEILSRTVGRKK